MRGIAFPSMLVAVGVVATLPALAQTPPASPRAPAATAAPAAQLAAGATVMVMDRVCLPVIEGASLDTVARKLGLQNRHGQWVYPIDANQRVELAPPDTANPHLCSVTIIHDVGAQPAIRQALDNWARSRTPPLQAIKVQVQAPGPQYLRTTSTWSGPGPHGELGIVFAGEKTLDGKPVEGQLDRSELLVGVTPAAT